MQNVSCFHHQLFGNTTFPCSKKMRKKRALKSKRNVSYFLLKKTQKTVGPQCRYHLSLMLTLLNAKHSNI